MRILLTVFIFLSLFVQASGQKQHPLEIRIVVVNEAKEALQNATISLLKYPDSILIKTEITNNAGVATLKETNNSTFQIDHS